MIVNHKLKVAIRKSICMIYYTPFKNTLSTCFLGKVFNMEVVDLVEIYNFL